jgi:hypothetical protein
MLVASASTVQVIFCARTATVNEFVVSTVPSGPTGIPIGVANLRQCSMKSGPAALSFKALRFDSSCGYGPLTGQ